jgi:hypothetical protein
MCQRLRRHGERVLALTIDIVVEAVIGEVERGHSALGTPGWTISLHEHEREQSGSR